jgi:hypothetical protein
MSSFSSARTLSKRLLIAFGATIGVVLICVFAVHLFVNQMYRGISSSKGTGLAAWKIFPASGNFVNDSQGPSISRSAELQSRTTAFDDSTSHLYRLVEAHRGYFEDLRTEKRSDQGRALAASFTVPATELDSTLEEMKTLGRVVQISVSSEDSTIKASRTRRRVDDAKNNLERLQALRTKNKAGIQDALALQKEIVKATDDLAQVEGEQQNLLSTVSRASVRFALIEEYRATIDTDMSGMVLELRNSLIEGLGGILSTVMAFLSALFEYGLPVGFWGAVLFFPARLIWKRLRRFRAAQAIPARS